MCAPNNVLKRVQLSECFAQHDTLSLSKLSAALLSEHCVLEALLLDGCSVAAEDMPALAVGLIRAASPLTELNLAGNIALTHGFLDGVAVL